MLNDRFTTPYKYLADISETLNIPNRFVNIVTIPIVALTIYINYNFYLKMHKTKYNYFESPITSDIFFYF